MYVRLSGTDDYKNKKFKKKNHRILLLLCMSQWSGVRARLVVAGTSELVPGWRLNFISRGRGLLSREILDITFLLYSIFYISDPAQYSTVQEVRYGLVQNAPDRISSIAQPDVYISRSVFWALQNMTSEGVFASQHVPYI